MPVKREIDNDLTPDNANRSTARTRHGRLLAAWEVELGLGAASVVERQPVAARHVGSKAIA
ncbi:hypothetical protein [Jiangella asiatica]|uniref:Uncharacterized protein n=1 Tax=Jiangella asiatica TaxID=2530372 RepID=A0A4R5D9D0_9ACTN|nr:hypothetical protein [Jiangella asiatica]TDE08014.1 hypothetical protein E1269_18935 [Jiangella asiatica]